MLPEFKAVIPETPITVTILPGRIEQVIDNLLENAFRYTGPEGTVELIVKEDPDRSVITIVRDTGRGIAHSNIDKIFDRFFTTEPVDRENLRSGLGRGHRPLNHCKTTAEPSGWRVNRIKARLSPSP